MLHWPACGTKYNLEPTPRFPFSQAVSQVALDAGGGLVAILRCLGEELQHNVGDG